jgi:lysophospholipase L1-like esterase
MAPIAVVNRGFGGSTIADLVRYVDHVFYGIKPRAVVVYSGENDVAWTRRDNTQKVLKDLQIFVDLVQTKYGAPPIFFISQKLPPFHRKRWNRLRQVNELIRNFAVSRSGVTFIDITGAMFEASGEPKRELYGPDGIHMSAKGYAVWTSIIRPYLERLET